MENAYIEKTLMVIGDVLSVGQKQYRKGELKLKSWLYNTRVASAKFVGTQGT